MNTDQIRTELQALAQAGKQSKVDRRRSLGAFRLEDVAALAGVHRNTLSNIIAGKGRIMTDTADKISAAIATLKRKKK